MQEQKNKISENIHQVQGDWHHLRELILNTTGKIYILLDENTYKYCYSILLQEVAELKRAEIIELEAGEENKILENCVSIWQSMSEGSAGRDSLLINLGGGVITDLGGFVASIYKRGIKFVNIPTTLLGMIDASIGGKTGVDFLGYKNQLGSFQQAEFCLIHPPFLKSLDLREMFSGFAELIKHALITENLLWQSIRNKKIQELNLEVLIPRAIEVKCRIVEEDPYEKGKRKALNFGHSIGHALESFFLQKGEWVRHGEAVAAGMLCESYISHKKQALSADELQQIIAVLDLNFERLAFDKKDIAEIMDWMKQDKKNVGSAKSLTLLDKIGQAVWGVEIEDETIVASLMYYLDEK